MDNNNRKRSTRKNHLIDFFQTGPLILEIDNLKIIFSDITPDWYLFECAKHNEEPEYLFQIEIKEKQGTFSRATYQKSFKPYPSYKHFNNFTMKILKDLVYRKELEVNGSWTDIVDYQSFKNNKINIICEYQIKMLNEMKTNKIRFKHLKELRTGGLDDFSKLRIEQLKEVLPSKTIGYAESELKDQNMVLKALRWVGRGLKPELSIRKAKVDKEIQDNTKRSWNS